MNDEPEMDRIWIEANTGHPSPEIARFEDDGGHETSHPRDQARTAPDSHDPPHHAGCEWTHDGCSGRAGELRGHHETQAAITSQSKDSMIHDDRDDEDPNHSLERKFEALFEPLAAEHDC